MPEKYLHGVYGDLGASQNLIAEASASTAAYVGTLPVHLVADYTDLVNRPVALTNYADALRKVGYSDDWDSFTLCEAIDAHFSNSVQPVGPIFVINVLDPDTDRGTQQDLTLNFAAGRALIPGDKTILNTVTIAGKTAGVDYALSYDHGRGGILVQDLTGTMTGEVSATAYSVTPEAVTAADIVGTVDTTSKTGLQALSYIYTEYGAPPALALAPRWSKEKVVHDALMAVCQKLNGKFYVFALGDLPFTYTAGGSAVEVKDIASAVNARLALSFTGEAEKTAWPMGAKTTAIGEKHYHISTITAVVMQQTDLTNNGIPYESPSNKPVDLNGYYIEGTKPPSYDEEHANELNAAGITTIVNRGGAWRLWGPHTAAYEYNGVTDDRAVFDSSMRMLFYLINNFILRNGDLIDTPLSRNAIDSILDQENSRLDLLVASGALLHADVQFSPSENSTEQMMRGDFAFNIVTTTVPVIKSVTAILSYTDAGAVELANILREEV